MSEILPYISLSIAFLSLILLKASFKNLALSCITQVDLLFKPETNEALKRKAILSGLITIIKLLFFNLIIISSIILLAFSPYLFFDVPMELNWLLGTILLTLIWIILLRLNPSKYNYWEELLHYLALTPVHLNWYFFQKRISRINLEKDTRRDFIIITGLARSGTTALLNQLYSTNQFKSLTYNNVPFLLFPDISIRGKKKNKTIERSHKDGIQINNYSPESFDEYFFQVALKNAYVGLYTKSEHKVTPSIYNNYVGYQSLVPGNKRYISKNNNFLLRYKSLKEFDKEFKVLVVVRDPLSQANSSLKQHLSFKKLQSDDPFILDYMNWLGHHEFGENHLAFEFNTKFQSLYNQLDLNYWICIWIHYHEYLLELLPDDQILIVSHQEFSSNNLKCIQSIASFLNLKVTISEDLPYAPTLYENVANVNTELLEKANNLYQKICEKQNS